MSNEQPTTHSVSVQVTRFRTRSGSTIITAEDGYVDVYSHRISMLADIEEFISGLREAAKLAGLK